MKVRMIYPMPRKTGIALGQKPQFRKRRHISSCAHCPLAAKCKKSEGQSLALHA